MGKKRKQTRRRRPSTRPVGDPWQEPSSRRWVRHVIDEMVPKLSDSSFVMSLVPDDREADVKFWVELGASICFDKPILVVAFNDAPLPPKLKLIADEIVRVPEGVNPEASEELADALRRMIPEERAA